MYEKLTNEFHVQVNVWQQIGAQEPHSAAAQLMKQNDNFGYKAPTQKLFMTRSKKVNTTMSGCSLSKCLLGRCDVSGGEGGARTRAEHEYPRMM